MPVAAPLLDHLVDDAAVFPPGNAPLPEALASHRGHRAAWYSPFVGPLLVPAAGIPELVGLVGDGEPVRVVVVARPGTPVEQVTDAVAAARGTGVIVEGVELGWQERWRELSLPGLPLVLEIPRGEDRDRALADVRDGLREGHPVLAKYRTGATPTWAWPDEDELAALIADAVELGLPIKLTGGLHHVVRADHGPGDPQHGLLNVLVAVATAQAHALGLDRPALAEILRERDPESLAATVRSWDDDTVERLRQTLTAYGCCGVTDPIHELVELDLVPGAS